MTIHHLSVHPSLSGGLTISVITDQGKHRLTLVEGFSKQGTFALVRDRVIRFYCWDLRHQEIRALFNNNGLAHRDLAGIELLLCKDKDWGYGATRFLGFIAGAPKHRWNEYSRTRGHIQAQGCLLVNTRVCRATGRITITPGEWMHVMPWRSRIARHLPLADHTRRVIEAVMHEDFDYPVTFNFN